MRQIAGQIARADGSLVAGRIAFSDRIEAIEPLAQCGRNYLLPGLIDLQVNGTHGMDVLTATVDDLTDMSRYLAREGVTAYLPTAITSTLETYPRIDWVIEENRRRNRDATDVAAILGMHLEGPFISARRLGVHPPLALEPRAENLERVLALGQLRLLTLAPELPGAIEATRRASERGIVVSLGHTDASLSQARSAIEAGARMFTHVFNAMRPLNHRDPGVVAAALEPTPALAAVIADGIHVHPQILALIFRARGAQGMILTSDKVGARPADAFQSNPANGNGAAHAPDGRLAGSLVPLLDGVRLMVKEVGVSPGQAALMASGNPARLLGLSDRGRLEPGCRADLLVLDRELNLKAVFIAGCELD